MQNVGEFGDSVNVLASNQLATGSINFIFCCSSKIKGEKSDWQGLKTAGEIRKERDIKLKQRSDSLYKPVERKKRVFHKLTVPKELKKDLPYKTKMKNQQKLVAGVNKATRVPVIREEKDKKASQNNKFLK